MLPILAADHSHQAASVRRLTALNCLDSASWQLARRLRYKPLVHLVVGELCRPRFLPALCVACSPDSIYPECRELGIGTN